MYTNETRNDVLKYHDQFALAKGKKNNEPSNSLTRRTDGASAFSGAPKMTLEEKNDLMTEALATN